jgi:hypothetical protein
MSLQDLKRRIQNFIPPVRHSLDRPLDDVVRLDAAALQLAAVGTPDLSPIIGVPVMHWDGTGRPSGWVGVSETWYRRGQVYGRGGKYVIDQNAMKWLDSAATPIRVRMGFRIYRIEGNGTRP